MVVVRPAPTTTTTEPAAAAIITVGLTERVLAQEPLTTVNCDPVINDVAVAVVGTHGPRSVVVAVVAGVTSDNTDHSIPEAWVSVVDAAEVVSRAGNDVLQTHLRAAVVIVGVVVRLASLAWPNRVATTVCGHIAPYVQRVAIIEGWVLDLVRSCTPTSRVLDCGRSNEQWIRLARPTGGRAGHRRENGSTAPHHVVARAREGDCSLRVVVVCFRVIAPENDVLDLQDASDLCLGCLDAGQDPLSLGRDPLRQGHCT
eukprot:COSAG02_NODE_1446_length_12578_cov_3.488661_3_plen_257_part_00